MKNYLNIVSRKIVHSLESFFEWYGGQVAKHPYISILGCLILTGLGAIGLINYRSENNAFKLWIPDNSDFVENNDWLETNAPMDARFNSLLLASTSNILEPDVIRHISQIKKKVEDFKTDENNLSWEDQCIRRQFPKLAVPPSGSGGAGSEGGGPAIPYPGVCNLLGQIMDSTCFQTSILEFWPLDFDFSKPFTREDVIERVNDQNAMSSTFNTPIRAESYLGGTIIKENGKIISAEATVMTWFGKVNFTTLSNEDDSGTGEAVDANSLEWEEKLSEILFKDQENLPNNLVTHINVARGFSDVAGETIKGDVIMMPVGYFIVFIYVTVMLGKFSCTEQRALLALGGLSCIGLTLLFTNGFCSAVGLFYSPMHSIIPFLLLGIGIDDMFVIMQCYDNLGKEKTTDVERNIALTLKHAGVAITVTSITDFIVFALGGTTVLPALRSFCLWCSVGILIIYFFSATLFTALLSLDCRRITGDRNGLCPCYVHKPDDLKTEDNDIEELPLSKKAFKYLSSLILSTPGSIATIVITLTLLSFGIWGMAELKQEFDPIWFLPPDSPIFKYFEKNKEYFPGSGAEVTVYFTDMKWDEDFDKIGNLVADFEAENDIIIETNDWFEAIKNANKTSCKGYNNKFNNLLTCFLFSTTTGFASQSNFKFKDKAELKCGEPSPDILLGKFTFKHRRFSGSKEHVPALNTVKEIMKKANQQLTGGGRIFAMSRDYSDWETDAVITEELLRNLGFAVICVFITTLLLLADFIGSVYVLLCVTLTLVNLCGYMHFWGLTIDVVSSVMIIIAIGLCVDYSAHICHTFLTISGDRRERSEGTLVNIGPAVLNGGISTFIAFILLAGSDSHVFSTFFKIFFLVVVFGLFHGLIFLPVVLRWLGPAAYQDARPYSSPGKGRITVTPVEME